MKGRGSVVSRGRVKGQGSVLSRGRVKGRGSVVSSGIITCALLFSYIYAYKRTLAAN